MTSIAFDIDGTIFDCNDIIVEAFLRGINRFNAGSPSERVTLPEKSRIMEVIGIPTDLIFRTLFPSLDRAGQDRINALCTETLSEMVRDGGGRIFDGVHSAISDLHARGCRLYVASNGKRPYIDAILSTHGLRNFFSDPFLLIDNETMHNKTDIVRRYITLIGPGELIIMVGDRSSDRNAAGENGIPFIACLFGHGAGSEIGGTPWRAERFGDIPGLIYEIERNRHGGTTDN